MKKILFILSVLIFQSIAFSKMIIHHRSPRNKKDQTYIFEEIILRAILDKTIKKYGYYELQKIRNMNTKRSIRIGEDNTFKNYVFSTSLTNKLTKKFAHTSIPFMKGIIGYRLFLTSKRTNLKLEMVQNAEHLKNFTMGQGLGWPDVAILRHSGYIVEEYPHYQTLFTKVEASQFDLLPRGANEILGELENNKNLKDLTYNKKVALYYPLPRVFYTNKKNTTLIERLNMGLEIIAHDGTLDKLWNKQFFKIVNKLNLKKMKIFELPNPLLEGLDKSYLMYLKKFHKKLKTLKYYTK